MAAVARALIGDIARAAARRAVRGLGPLRRRRAVRGLRQAAQEVSIVIVEHNLDLVLALADHAYVLERGSVVYEGPARPLLKDLDLRRQVLWL